MKSGDQILLEVFRHAVFSRPDLLPAFERVVLLARRKNQWNEVLKNDVSVEDRFTKIFKDDLWDGGESRSGPGSGLAYTSNLRSRLPALFDKYQVKSVFDAPCGDFHWMQHLLAKVNIDYIGGDIVRELIEKNQKKFGRTNINFVHVNIIANALPSADLMICRDCLFHFSYQDILKTLQNFVRSKIAFLLTTTHTTGLKNRDILTGDFRQINLFDFPFDFTPQPLERIDDWMKPEPERQMCLWTRAEVEMASERLAANLSTLPNTD